MSTTNKYLKNKLEHSAAGDEWENHKWVDRVPLPGGGFRYIYPEDVQNRTNKINYGSHDKNVLRKVRSKVNTTFNAPKDGSALINYNPGGSSKDANRSRVITSGIHTRFNAPKDGSALINYNQGGSSKDANRSRAVTSGVRTRAQSIGNNIKTAGNNVGNFTKQIIPNAAEFYGNKARSVANGLKQVGQNAADFYGPKAREIGDALKKKTSSAKAKASEWINRLFKRG